MCDAQSSIYFMCICISLLTIASNAFSENDGVYQNPKFFERNETQEKYLKNYVAKVKLRSELKKKLEKLTTADKVAQSKVITKLLLSHPLYESSHRVAVYVSLSSEVQTFDIIKDIIESGKSCYVPKYDKYNNLSMLKLRSLEDYMTLPKTRLNISQPADNDLREDAMDSGGLDLIIVPGLGFTTYGKRLGRGKGCYDRFLMEYNKTFPDDDCMTVGLAFTEQLCDDIPTTPEDQPVYFVLYPDE